MAPNLCIALFVGNRDMIFSKMTNCGIVGNIVPIRAIKCPTRYPLRIFVRLYGDGSMGLEFCEGGDVVDVEVVKILSKIGGRLGWNSFRERYVGICSNIPNMVCGIVVDEIVNNSEMLIDV